MVWIQIGEEKQNLINACKEKKRKKHWFDYFLMIPVFL